MDATSDANGWLAEGILAELEQDARVQKRARPVDPAGPRPLWSDSDQRTRIWAMVRAYLREASPFAPRRGVEKPDG